MEAQFQIELLDVLIENANRLLRAGFGLDWNEPGFFQIIDLLRESADLKKHFIEKVRSTFALRDPGLTLEGTVPRELVELVAHEFRWPEIQDLAARRIEIVFHGDASMAAGDVARSVSQAYADDWEDREYYKRYTKPQA